MPTTKALSASKFFGKDRYEYYLNELLTQQKVGGNALSKSQIKEGFLKRKDKISFEKFVEKLLNTKAAKSAITPPEIKSSPVAGGVGLGSRGGGLVKSPTGALEKYVSGVSKPKKMGGIEDDISKITKSVISIAEILSGQKKLKDSSTSYDRRKAEQEKRSLAESKLEKRFDGLKKAAEKILAPVKSLLDKIINFFVTVFLGRIVYKLLEWFGDPKNADKVKSISRFLKDFGPAILTAFVLFGTSFGRLTLGLTKMIGGFIFKIGKVLIPQLLKLIARNPKVALAAGLFTAGATVPAMFPGTVDEQERKTKSKPGSTEDKIKALEQQKANLNPLQKMQGVGSEIDEQLSALKTGQTKSYGFSGGGSVKIPAFKGGGFNFKGMFGGALGSSPEKPQEMPNGFVSGEKGVDKVPAMLSDGEFVMSVGAVQKYGVDTLEGMNAAGGGTNKPKMMNGKTYAAGGGRVGYEGEDPIADILAWFKSQGIDPSNPKTWFPPGNSGGGGSSPPPGNSGGGGGGFKFPEIPGVPGLPGGGGGGFKFPEIPGVPGLPPGLPGGFNPEKYIPEEYRGDYNRAKKAAGEGIDFVRGQVGNARNNAIRDGYLSKRGRYEGAAKAQNNNFLSDMLPNLPGVSNINKAVTESYLTKIGIGRNTKNITKQGENFTKAFYQGKSGIDRGYNVGQLQVNKMSGESKDYYLKKVKEGLSNGTLKSGDTITPYDLSAKDPRRREEGTLRFYVGPDGSPYLMDTYGFDPGKVNLGSEQKKYDEQVAKFRSGKSIMGKIAKSLNLKPLADATEGGEKVQFALALRNKIFGYDPEEEAKKKLGMRFKTKVQVDELRKSMSPEELKQLLQLGKDQLSTNETSLLRNADKKNDTEKLEKEKVKPSDQKNQKQLEKNRPFYDPFGTFGGASRVIKDKEKEFASTGFGGKYASPSTTSLGPDKLYTKPQPNTKQPYKSKFARPKNAGTSPVNPPIRPTRPTRPTTLPTGSGSSSGGSSTSGGKKSSGAGTQTPSFSARNPSGGRSKQETLGLMR